MVNNLTTPINWTNVTNASQLLGLANDVTHGWFWFGIIAMFFIILVLILLSYGIEVALVTSSLVATMGAFLLFTMDLVNGWGVLFFMSIFLFSFIIVYGTSTRESV